MKLTEARRLFFEIRGHCQIVVKDHTYKDYPERGFSQREIIDLIRTGRGRFLDNDSIVAILGSFLFFTKDELDRVCKLVVLIEQIEIEGQKLDPSKVIIVCSAYREVTDEI